MTENEISQHIVEAAIEMHRMLEGDVETLENRIDQAVFQLYGVDGLPA